MNSTNHYLKQLIDLLTSELREVQEELHKWKYTPIAYLTETSTPIMTHLYDWHTGDLVRIGNSLYQVVETNRNLEEIKFKRIEENGK